MKDVKDVKVCRLMSSGSSPVLETSSCACSGCEWQEARDSLTLCNNESAKACKNCNKAGTGKEHWSLLESPNTQYTVYAKSTQQSLRRSLRTFIVMELKNATWSQHLAVSSRMRQHIPKGMPRAKKPAMQRETARNKAKQTYRNYEPQWTKDKMCHARRRKGMKLFVNTALWHNDNKTQSKLM